MHKLLNIMKKSEFMKYFITMRYFSCSITASRSSVANYKPSIEPVDQNAQ